MKNRSTILLFVSLVLALPVLAFVILSWYENSLQPLPFLGPVGESRGTKSMHTISNFSLTDQAGQLITAADWKDNIIVVDFFFTHCPAVCLRLAASFKKVQESFPSDNHLLFNSFSVDPVGDSVPVLRQYAERLHLDTHNWHLLTGDKKEIYKLARNSFMLVATDGDGGPEDFIHSEKLVLIDKQKRIRGYYTGTDDTEVNKLIHDIKRLKNGD